MKCQTCGRIARSRKYADTQTHYCSYRCMMDKLEEDYIKAELAKENLDIMTYELEKIIKRLE